MNTKTQTRIFDRKLLRQRRARAEPSHVLFEESAAQIIDRLDDVKKDFQSVLLTGRASDLFKQHFTKDGVSVTETQFTDDEVLPAAPNSFDLIISNWDLHWINDLPGVLLQIKQTLKPEGLFMASFPGGRTLHELRTCLLDAELAVAGGVSPRLSPMVDFPVTGALMQRAGFALPVTDMETVILTYPDAFALMRDLRGMGETNTHHERLRQPTRRAVFEEAARLYQKRYAAEDGRIAAAFETIFLHGWREKDDDKKLSGTMVESSKAFGCH